MRHPRSTLSAVVALACAALALALIAPGALATGRADGLAEVQAKLKTCQNDLFDAHEALDDTKELLQLTKKRPFVFLVVPGFGAMPIAVDVATNAIILEFVNGQSTRAQLTRKLQDLGRRARQTVQLLKETIAESQEGVERIAKRCAALTAEQSRLRAAGGGGSGGGTTTTAKTGAFPGGTATELTFTVAGNKVTTDLKTNKMTAEPTLKAKSSTTVNGSATLNGTLPSGWSVVVIHNGGSDIVLNSPSGGEFTLKAISTGFDAFTRPSAYICATKVPPLCSPAAQASITIDWDP